MFFALEIPKPRNLHLAKGQIIFEDVRPRPLIDKQPIQTIKHQLWLHIYKKI